MSTYSTFIITSIFSVFFIGCASSQFEKGFPFEIEEAAYTVSDQSYQIEITTLEPIIDVPSVVYFRDKSSSSIRLEDKNTLHIFISRLNTGNIIMHKDPKKEYGNTIGNNNNTKFKLKENEVVLGFKEGNGSLNYYKIIAVTK